MMKKKRVRRIKSKVLSIQVNLRNVLKKLPAREGTVPFVTYKLALKSFLDFAESYESLLEIYEMDVDK